ncbi:hypothetical protein [Bradyrhizobium archetypum]|uniref:Uncharacterized protein n=1 Tax=Bradyrhizobium archetypum TaxID=2721160 RepID=A0A7Y4H728_9BRAD|nr:hypothetical protein [Bradyrhizobium archetypum]NOJ48427.1 hypothetical protein [Bradyrhizobium archetypum]
MTYAFPSVANMSAQSYLRQRGITDVSAEGLAKFSSRVRSLDAGLTDRAAMVLYLAAKCPGMTVRETEVALAAKTAVVWAVLRGIAIKQVLIEITAGEAETWQKRVQLSPEGEKLVAAAEEASS